MNRVGNDVADLDFDMDNEREDDEEGTDIDVSLDGFEPLVDGAIDLGEVVAQTLAISVNPWPRSVDAPHSFAVGESEKEHPFAGLAALKSSD